MLNISKKCGLKSIQAKLLTHSLMLCGILLCWSPKIYAQVPPDSDQVILVLAAEWSSDQARLQRFERNNNRWLAVGSRVPVVLGRKGLGWGRGLFQPEDTQGDFRQEGDERSPAGIFPLGPVFGLATSQEANQWLTLNMPYLHLSDSIRCVGDSTSPYYNQLINLKQTKDPGRHPEANENMRRDAIRDEGAYRWGIFVAHNQAQNPEGMPGDQVSGSCIFIHLWKGPGIGTSGCTALSKANILNLINWLDDSKKPVLVQLTQADYQRLKTKWGLPEWMP